MKLAGMPCERCGQNTGRSHPSNRVCDACISSKAPWIQAAYRAVQRAIRRGDLPRARTCVCVDCGASARDYDHRDYSKPLEVDSVCRSCNLMRGAAIDANRLPQRRAKSTQQG